MDRIKIKTLIITHDTFPTGAPYILLNFIRWLKNRDDLDIDVLIRRNGPLNREFIEIAKSLNWNPPRLYLSKFPIIGKLCQEFYLTLYKKRIINKIKNENYKLIYANTIACSDVLYELLKRINVPVILHVHELEMAIKFYCDLEKFNHIKDRISRFIAVSKIVQQNLILNHKISENKIDIIHEFAAFSPIPQRPREAILRDLKIPLNAFIIGGSGTIEWRKGVDLFVQIANKIRKLELRERSVYFIWIGGFFEKKFLNQIQYDIENTGLSDRLFLLGHKSNPVDYYNLFDILILPSREDPFPLVSIENGLLGNPILCFDKQVGSAEFIDDSCGKIVPYLDIEAISQAALSFYLDQGKLISARKIIKERTAPYQIEYQGQKLLKVIQACTESI